MKEGDPPRMELAGAVTFKDVKAAAHRLGPVAERTPVLTPGIVDEMTGATTLLKCESFQRIGAFKFRGAYNAISQLEHQAREGGVLTYSSGNHAQAMALAAALLNTPVVILMPENASQIKLDATREYVKLAPEPSEVITYAPGRHVREELGARLAAERGLTIIPPYDHPDIIAGQGTCAVELIEDAGEIDLLLAPCGGGGLLSGCAIAAQHMSKRCRVIGVEPEMADDAARSFRTGRLHTVRDPPTIADGARTPHLGEYTFAIVADRVSEFVTVSEQEIAAAMRLCMERLKLVVEPTGAVGLAGLLKLAKLAPEQVRGARVGVIISGGNVDLERIDEILALDPEGGTGAT